MLLFDDLVNGFYVVPFLMALALPGWRSLAAVAAVGIGVTALEVLRPSPGVAGSLAVAFVVMTATGLLCGVVTRAVTLWLAPFNRRPFAFAAIVVIGFFAWPGINAGPSATLAWLMRPSLQTCRASTFPVRVAGETLHVPAAPMFSVRAPSKDGRGESFLWFQDDRSIREMCARTFVNNDVVAPAVVHVNASTLGGTTSKKWAQATCTPPRNERDALLCRLAARSAPGGLELAILYGPETARDVQRRTTYAVDKTIASWLAAGRPHEPADGTAQRPVAGLQTASGPGLTGPSGEPFGWTCEGGPHLLCAAAGVLDDGTLLKFTMRGPADKIDDGAREIRAYLNDLVRALKAP